MDFLSLLVILIIIFIIYLIYSSEFVQILISKKTKKDLISRLTKKVRGVYLSKGHFGIPHKIVENEKFKTFSNKEKLNYSSCYNIIEFKTQDTNWELFFNLIKVGATHSEILNIRVFPKNNHIKSEGNIEKNYSRLNIFTNNRYLSNILENTQINETLNWLVKNNADSMQITRNSIHFKMILNKKNKLNSDEIMDIIKALNQIKSKIYKEGILEY